MPHIKNALIRYRIIDKVIRNTMRPFPSKEDLRCACEEELFGSTSGDHICDSTIEKDLKAMRMEMDAPIKYSKREDGYYYSDANFSINEVPLNESDLEAIKFAASTLMQFRDVSVFRQFGDAIDKIVDGIAVNETAGSKQEEFIQFETVVKVGGSEYLPDLVKAIRARTAVYFEYQSFQSDKPTPRKVLPLLLKEYRNRWYLISQDEVKNRVITYALDRMSKVDFSQEKLVPPHDFNPDNYFRYAIGITSGTGSPEQILFKATTVASRYLESQPIHATQQVVKSGKKRKTFKLEVHLSEELIREFLAYGDALEIIAPQSLRSEVLRRVKGMMKLYSN